MIHSNVTIPTKNTSSTMTNNSTSNSGGNGNGNGPRQSLSKRLKDLSDSKSYMFLGRGSTGAATITSGRSPPSRLNSTTTIMTTKTNLVRDDFLIFELIFHAQENYADAETNKSNTKGATNWKRTIRDPSDYSVQYHNWTLRQLYRHVVASTKIHSSTAAVSALASPRTNKQTLEIAFASGDGVAASKAERRARSISMSGNLFSPPPPVPFGNYRSSFTTSGSSRHRNNSNNNNNNNNNTSSTNHHHHHNHHPKFLGSNLHPRDMRRLVTPFSASNEPELIVRRHVMVFNFDPLRAIITRDRLLVLVPDGADSILKNLEERIAGSGLEYDGYEDETETESNCNDGRADEVYVSKDFSVNTLESVMEVENGLLHGKDDGAGDQDNAGSDQESDDDWSEMMMEMEGQRDDLTFELLCVNACLSTVFEMLADDTNELQDRGLEYVQDRIIGEKQRLRPEDALAVIRNLKNATKVMQARVKGFVHSINRILNEDEDMALMNLSRLVTHPENFLQPISQEMLEVESDEPELVLESNLHNALTLSNALDLIEGKVETASDLIDARMDAARNKFLLASLVMSIASLSLTALSCIGGIFGMNLRTGLEDEPGKFVQVLYGSISGSVVLGIAIFAGMVSTGVISGIGPVDKDGIDTLF